MRTISTKTELLLGNFSMLIEEQVLCTNAGGQLSQATTDV